MNPAEYLIVGDRREPGDLPAPGTPGAYARLLQRFGAGEFLGEYNLLLPGELGSYAELIPIADADPELQELLVLVTGNNGDAFAWHARDPDHLAYVPCGTFHAADVRWRAVRLEGWEHEILQAPYAPPGLARPYFVHREALGRVLRAIALSPGASFAGALEQLGRRLERSAFQTVRYQATADGAASVSVHLALGAVLSVFVVDPDHTLAAFDTRVTLRCRDEAPWTLVLAALEELGWAAQVQTR